MKGRFGIPAITCGVGLLAGVLVGAGSSDAALSGAVLITVATVLTALWRSWRSDNAATMGGIVLLFPLVYVAAVYLGSVSSEIALFDARIDTGQWVLYAVGLLAFLFGAKLHLIVTGARSMRSRRNDPIRPGVEVTPVNTLRLAYMAGAVGVAVSTLNFMTGTIPLLSGDTDFARFNGTAGVASKAWVIAIPLEVYAAVVLLLHRQAARGAERQRIRLVDGAVLFAVGLCLTLTAARSFVVVIALAVAVVKVEERRPRLRTIAIAALLGFVATAGLGYLRVQHSADSDKRLTFLEARGFGRSVLSPGLVSITAGPAVFAAVRETIPKTVPYQQGSFLLRDASGLIGGNLISSDRWVTELLLRDPNSVGGLPPTVVGGFYIDGGGLGVAIGMCLLGFITSWVRAFHLRNETLATRALYGYWSAYLLLSLYSYVSLKLTVMGVLLACAVAHWSDRVLPEETQRPLEYAYLAR